MRLYLIGAGAIARDHARAAAALAKPYAELHVCDPREEARASFAKAYPAFQCWPDFKSMLAAPAAEGDLVIVATPPSSHVDLAEAVMQGGRDVLVEKPLALSVQDLSRLKQAAAKSSRRFGDCAVRFVATPAQLLASRLISEGRLGRLRQLSWRHRARRFRPGVEYQPESHWFLNKSLAGGGILLDWGPYDFAAICAILDPAAFEVRHAWTRRFINGFEPKGVVNDVETQAAAACVLTLKDGAKVELSYERASAVYGREEGLAEIEGESGALRLDWLGWNDKGRLHLSTDEGGQPKDEIIESGPVEPEPHFKPLHYFSSLTRGEGGPGYGGGRACFVHACVLAVAAAAEGGGPQRVLRSDWEDA